MNFTKRTLIQISFCLFVIFSYLSAFATISFASEQEGKVTAYVLNVREKADANSKVIGSLSENTKVSIIGTNGKWYKIKFKNSDGFVHSDYIEVSKSLTGSTSWITTTATALNIRESASTSSKVVGTLIQGQAAEVISTSNGWTKIKKDNITGFISTSYTKATQKPAVIPPTDNSTNKPEITKRQATIIVDALNIRSQSNTQSNVVGIAKKNQTFDVIEVKDKWAAITYKNSTAFISVDYIKLTTTSGDLSDNTNNEVVSSETIGYVTASSLNIRNSPNANSEIVGKLSLNEKITILDVQDNWGRFTYQNKNAYVSMSYISQTTSETEKPNEINYKYVVNTAVLNVRKTPSTSGAKLGQVTLNNELSVTSSENGWLKINFNNTVGYVASNYVDKIEATSTQPSTPTSSALKGKKIIIDAGHGGKDSGAIGYGLKEKDIVLDTALKLREKLARNGATVILTRSTDVYLTLEQRTKISNSSSGDIFISIHNNGSDLTAANGVETYYSTSNPKSSQSLKLAQTIQKELINDSKMVNRGVKTANYWVIKGNQLPSVLVETGFITNKYDSSMLAEAQYRDKLADMVYTGVLNYFK